MNESNYLEQCITSEYWRLNNLYSIADKYGRKIKFKFNWAQQELYENTWYCNIILKARQLGISTYICLLFLDKCLFNSNISAGVIAQTREDAENLFRRIKFAYDSLPEWIKTRKRATSDSARQLVFSNGSSISVGTSMRGSTLQYLHISEFGKICAKYPEKAQEIVTGSLNTLAPGQYVFIESTAEGREGYFYEMCHQAQKLKDSGKELSKVEFRFHFFPWYKEHAYRIGSPLQVSQDMYDYFIALKTQGIDLDNEQKWWYAAKELSQKDNMKREYPSTPQESFEQSIDGSYYSKYIRAARLEKRICRVPYDPTLPVYTSWDLGYNDATSIWIFQVYGKEVRLIEYVEGHGESLTHWLNMLKHKTYIYDIHLAPHDIKAHEYTTGMTRQASAAKLGFRLTAVPKTEVIHGIDTVRDMLNRCWFDEVKCEKGIRALENYKKEWDERYGCWSRKPVHNEHSHGCFTEDTLIDCVGYGREKISRIKENQKVYTPNGLKKVEKVFIYEVNELYEITTTKNKFKCTGNHKIFTKRGLISADAVTYKDIVYTNSKKDKRLCRKRYGKEESIGFKENFLLAPMNYSSSIVNVFQGIGRERVMGINKIYLKEKIKVYDISVEEDHCYYANGILVSNSDAFRTLATGLSLITGRKTPEEIERAYLESMKDASGCLPGSIYYDGNKRNRF